MIIHLNYCLSIASTLLFVLSTFLVTEAQESVAADKPVEVQDAVSPVSPTSPKSELAVSKQVRLHPLIEVPSVSIEHQVAVSLSKPEATSLAFGTDLIVIALPELDQAIIRSAQDEPFSLPPAKKTSTIAADLEMSTDESAQFPLWDRLMGPTQVVQNPNDSAPNTNPARATPEQPQGSANLAQEAQNPIANLISVPLQNNFNFNVGPFNRTQYVLNIQPVIPVPLSKDLLLVTRTIVPLVSQPTAGIDPTTQELRPGNPTFGLGDINPQFFFVPRTGSNLTWGVGPIFLLPTATDEVLGTGKWGAGPNGVLVWTSGKWLVGALVNQIWSFAGDNDRTDVSQFLIQPFVNYSLPDGWTVGTGPSITANWNAAAADKWTVPLGASVSKLLTIGTQPVSVALAGYYNVERPTFGPDWTLRFTFTLLFPTGR